MSLRRQHRRWLEILVVRSGWQAIQIDRREHVLRAGELTIVWPDRKVVLAPSAGATSRFVRIRIALTFEVRGASWRWPSWLMLADDDLRDLANVVRRMDDPVVPSDSTVRRCLDSLTRLLEGPWDGRARARITIRLHDLLLSVLESLERDRRRAAGAKERVRPSIEQFATAFRSDPDKLAAHWTVSEMARACGLGVTQFVHHFRTLTNDTPMRYLNSCRLDFAAHLLEEDPRRRVVDVATGCGFSSSQYFATQFARRFGISPRAFRDSAGRARRA